MPPNDARSPELTPPASAVATAAFARGFSGRASSFASPHALAAGIGTLGRAADLLARSLMGRAQFGPSGGRPDWLAALLSRYRIGAWGLDTPSLHYMRRLRAAPGGMTETDGVASPLSPQTARWGEGRSRGAERPPAPPVSDPASARAARPGNAAGGVFLTGSLTRLGDTPRRAPLLPGRLAATQPLPAMLRLHHATLRASLANRPAPAPLRSAFPEVMAEAVTRRLETPARRGATPAPEREPAEMPMALSYPPIPLASWLGVAASAPEQTDREHAPGFARAVFSPAAAHLLSLPKLSAEVFPQPTFERPSEAAFAALPRMAAVSASRQAADSAAEAFGVVRAAATQPIRPLLEQRPPAAPLGMRGVPQAPAGEESSETPQDGGEAHPAAARPSPLRAAQSALEFVQRFAVVPAPTAARFGRHQPASHADRDGRTGLAAEHSPFLLPLPQLRRALQGTQAFGGSGISLTAWAKKAERDTGGVTESGVTPGWQGKTGALSRPKPRFIADDPSRLLLSALSLRRAAGFAASVLARAHAQPGGASARDERAASLSQGWPLRKPLFSEAADVVRSLSLPRLRRAEPLHSQVYTDQPARLAPPTNAPAALAAPAAGRPPAGPEQLVQNGSSPRTSPQVAPQARSLIPSTIILPASAAQTRDVLFGAGLALDRPPFFSRVLARIQKRLGWQGTALDTKQPINFLPGAPGVANGALFPTAPLLRLPRIADKQRPDADGPYVSRAEGAQGLPNKAASFTARLSARRSGLAPGSTAAAPDARAARAEPPPFAGLAISGLSLAQQAGPSGKASLDRLLGLAAALAARHSETRAAAASAGTWGESLPLLPLTLRRRVPAGPGTEADDRAGAPASSITAAQMAPTVFETTGRQTPLALAGAPTLNRAIPKADFDGLGLPVLKRLAAQRTPQRPGQPSRAHDAPEPLAARPPLLARFLSSMLRQTSGTRTGSPAFGAPAMRLPLARPTGVSATVAPEHSPQSGPAAVPALRSFGPHPGTARTPTVADSLPRQATDAREQRQPLLLSSPGGIDRPAPFTLVSAAVAAFAGRLLESRGAFVLSSGEAVAGRSGEVRGTPSEPAFNIGRVAAPIFARHRSIPGVAETGSRDSADTPAWPAFRVASPRIRVPEPALFTAARAARYAEHGTGGLSDGARPSRRMPFGAFPRRAAGDPVQARPANAGDSGASPLPSMTMAQQPSRRRIFGNGDQPARPGSLSAAVAAFAENLFKNPGKIARGFRDAARRGTRSGDTPSLFADIGRVADLALVQRKRTAGVPETGGYGPAAAPVPVTVPPPQAEQTAPVMLADALVARYAGPLISLVSDAPERRPASLSDLGGRTPQSDVPRLRFLSRGHQQPGQGNGLRMGPGTAGVRLGGPGPGRSLSEAVLGRSARPDGARSLRGTPFGALPRRAAGGPGQGRRADVSGPGAPSLFLTIQPQQPEWPQGLLPTDRPSVQALLRRWLPTPTPAAASTVAGWAEHLVLPRQPLGPVPGGFQALFSETPRRLGSDTAAPRLPHMGRRLAAPSLGFADVSRGLIGRPTLKQQGVDAPPQSAHDQQRGTTRLLDGATAPGLPIDEGIFSEAIGAAVSRALQFQILTPVREFLLATLARLSAPGSDTAEAAFPARSGAADGVRQFRPFIGQDLPQLRLAAGADGGAEAEPTQTRGVPSLPGLTLPSLQPDFALGAADASARSLQTRPLGPTNAFRLPTMRPITLGGEQTSSPAPTYRSPGAVPFLRPAGPLAARPLFAAGRPDSRTAESLPLFRTIDTLLAQASRLDPRYLDPDGLGLPTRLSLPGQDSQEPSHRGDAHSPTRALDHLPVRPEVLSARHPGANGHLHGGRGVGTLSEKSLEMPLPMRPAPMEGRAGALPRDPLLIQRATAGSVTAPGQSAGPDEQDGAEEGGGGGHQDVHALAKEVWSHLRRRLAHEAMRAGQR